MIKLSTAQFIYLLYAYSYCLEGETVTKSTVKKAVDNKVKENTDRIYDALLKQDLIESPKKGRLLVTTKGITTLVDNIGNADYKFSNKNSQYRILNTLMQCWKLASSTKLLSSVQMDFDKFVEKFKEFYFQEKKRQELSGVVAIHKHDIYKKFLNNSVTISIEEWNEYLDRLKSTGKVFTSKGEEDELVHWAE
ncbi:hypothetical protein [Fischerella sp. PCC 9605]|uniref:hypothetical protein n=1 Tax=Fischerella sp. PCC 9605 TaxID=1173024 RepID=UPI00047D2CE3|nr:hypothetical protein [Fischerella sp. PCC 9605]